MSYRVNKRTKLDGTIYWRLLFERWENGERHDDHIPVSQLLSHGFTPTMSLEEARARAQQLNAQGAITKKEERRKLRTLARAKEEQLLESAHLPKLFCHEFEEKVLKERFCNGANAEAKYTKILSHWLYVKRMLIVINRDPSIWIDEPRVFYNYFVAQKSAPDYVAKLLRVLNLWGHFISRKEGKAFLPVPAPTGYNRERIYDAYFESEKTKKTSEPLTPDMLESARSSLKEEQYRWLHVSVWLGLRPKEIDSLRSSPKGNPNKHPALEVEMHGRIQVLKVYQTKLTSVPRDKRWKYIPLLYKEQREALRYIKEGKLTRPLVKTIKKYISEEATCYGGRKGFTDLMLNKGQALEDISMWMGHAGIERTWKSYKQKNVVRFTKPAA